MIATRRPEYRRNIDRSFSGSTWPFTILSVVRIWIMQYIFNLRHFKQIKNKRRLKKLLNTIMLCCSKELNLNWKSKRFKMLWQRPKLFTKALNSLCLVSTQKCYCNKVLILNYIKRVMTQLSALDISKLPQHSRLFL